MSEFVAEHIFYKCHHHRYKVICNNGATHTEEYPSRGFKFAYFFCGHKFTGKVPFEYQSRNAECRQKRKQVNTDNVKCVFEHNRVLVCVIKSECTYHRAPNRLKKQVHNYCTAEHKTDFDKFFALLLFCICNLLLHHQILCILLLIILVALRIVIVVVHSCSFRGLQCF